MLENYHTHTARCRHATGTEEEYVQKAIAGGLQILGFSDHTPFLFPGDYYSHMRMYPQELEDYVQTVLALKEKYADQIQIRLGLEVEYYPALMPDLMKLIQPYDIEYLILGQHWCGNEQDSPYNGRATEDVAHLERYCNQVIAAMDTGLFSYVAHPDLIHFTGSEDAYVQHITRLCKAAKAHNIPLEINLLGMRSDRHYPNPLFWKIAGTVGCTAVLGCDAHTPADVTDPQSESVAMQMVNDYNLTLLEHVPTLPYRK